MDRRICLVVVLAFVFSAILMSQNVKLTRAEGAATDYPADLYKTPEGFAEMTWGTDFQVANSAYLNISVKSSVSVNMSLESIPRMVSFVIEGDPSTTTTDLTLSGFDPSTTYYRHQDGYLVEMFTTNSDGGYAYTQDISTVHRVYFLEHTSTLYISSNYTFTGNIYEPIVVDADNIVIDGNGYTLQGSGTGIGFYLFDRTGVTIKNVVINQWSTGIVMDFSFNNTISENTVTNAVSAISLDYSDHITLTGNQIESNQNGIRTLYAVSSTLNNNKVRNNVVGLYLWRAYSNAISGNTATNNRVGVLLEHSSRFNNLTDNQVAKNNYGVESWDCSNNVLNGNNITANNAYGIYMEFSYGNIIYHNIIDNPTQAYDTDPSLNYWYNPSLLEGNYWSDYPGVDDGSGTGKHAIAGDGIGDTFIPWPELGYDYYPFVWTAPPPPPPYYLRLVTSPSEMPTPTGQGWYDSGVYASIATPEYHYVTQNIRYRFDDWTTPNMAEITDPSSASTTVLMDRSKTVTANYVLQYYLTIVSLYDAPSGEGWYDAGETAYALLNYGFENVNGTPYGFIGWSGDASGLDLTSNPILMNGPKTAVASWEANQAYEDVRTTGFWRHQFTKWYRSTLGIQDAEPPEVSTTDLEAYLAFIWNNSEYFKTKYPSGIALIDAYNLLTPLQTHTMKDAAEQQLLAVWLNLARKAFFWNTQLNDSKHIYATYGLQDIGQAIVFSEAELMKPNGDYEAAKNICDSINSNQGIIWET